MWSTCSSLGDRARDCTMKVVKLRWKVIVAFTLAWFLVILLTYVYIWDDTSDFQYSGKRRLVANGNYFRHQGKQAEVELEDGWGRGHEVKVRLEVKGGDRQPQGVMPDDQRLDNEDDDRGAKSKDRALEYCNPPEDISGGAEGQVPAEYNLEHVHAVIRHGVRSSMYAVPGYETPWIPCEVIESLTATDHTARSYVKTMKRTWAGLAPESQAFRFGLFPHSRYCEGAQLTGRGAMQQIRNGQHLHNVYKNRWGQEQRSLKPNQVHVFSTEYSRTYQSAIAFLFGLLPDHNPSSVPVMFSRFTNFCSTKLTGLTCDCTMAYRLEAIIKKEYGKRSRNSTLHAHIKKDISNILGVPKNKLPWVSALSDVFNGHICHNINLPCSRVNSSLCVTWPLIGKVWEFLDTNGAAQLASYAYQRQQRLLMHPLLHIISHRMYNVTLGREVTRFVLYSGHDKTVTPLTTALGFHDGKWPSFAARVVFEMYSKSENDSDNDVYYIRVLYNGQDKTQMLRFCKGKLVDGLCPFDVFQHYVFYEDLQYFGKNTYQEACML